jgi:hypothetical protein
MDRQESQIRAQLCIQSEGILGSPGAAASDLEGEIGFPLRWDELRREARVSVLFDGAGPEDWRDWPRQHEWLAKRLNDLHRTFAIRIRALQLQ